MARRTRQILALAPVLASLLLLWALLALPLWRARRGAPGDRAATPPAAAQDALHDATPFDAWQTAKGLAVSGCLLYTSPSPRD